MHGGCRGGVRVPVSGCVMELGCEFGVGLQCGPLSEVVG